MVGMLNILFHLLLDPATLASRDQLRCVVEGVCRVGLCEEKDTEMVLDALDRARVPNYLLSKTVPGDSLWDTDADEKTRIKEMREFVQNQRMVKALTRGEYRRVTRVT